MKSIKAALKRKSQKDRQQLGDMNACCVLLGGGEGSSLASLTLLMAYQVIKEGLTSSTPPAFLAPHSAWEPMGTSQTQARLWANPPHPKVDDHTSDSHYFPYPINKAQFFFLSLSISLFPPSPLKTARTFMLYESIWNVKRFSGRSFHHSVRIGFSCALPPASMPTCLMSHKM